MRLKLSSLILALVIVFSGSGCIGKICDKGSCAEPSAAQTISNLPLAPSGVALMTPANSPGNNASPTVRVLGVSTGHTVDLFLNTTCTAPVYSSQVAAGSYHDFSIGALGADGTYFFSARVTDASAVVSNCSPTLSYELDTAAPSINSFLINSGVTYTQNLSVDLNSNVDGASEMYFSNSNCSSGGIWEPYSVLRSGWNLSSPQAANSVYGNFRDLAGNTACAMDTIIHDSVAPVAVSGLTLGPTPASLSETPIISYSPAEGGPTYVSIHLASDSSVVHGPVSFSSGNIVNGLSLIAGTQYFIRVYQVDFAGNVGATADSAAWTAMSPGPTLWNWTSMTTLGAPSPRVGFASAWTGSKLIVWGGCNTVSPDNCTAGNALNTGGIYDPATDTWTTITTSGAPSKRGKSAAYWDGTYFYILGGWNGSTNYDDFYRYDPLTDAWSGLSGDTGIWRHDFSLIGTGGGNLFAFGGDMGPTGSPTYTDDPRRFNGSSWAAGSTTSQPAVRAGAAAFFISPYVVIWGGFSTGLPLNTGGRYNYSMNSWLPTSTAGGAPATGRRDFASATTGTEMLIWGGYDGTTRKNDGYIYNPNTNTWSGMNTAGSPEAVNYTAGDWTGIYFMVWGGINSVAARISSGGAYDRANSYWYTLPTTNAPTARSHHIAVWTGTKFLIWGGTDGVLALDTGGLLSP